MNGLQFGLSGSGFDAPDNWQPLCGRCNRFKSVFTNQEATTATHLRSRDGNLEPWPRGFDHQRQRWLDGSALGYVHGMLFSYPIRVALPSCRYANAA